MSSNNYDLEKILKLVEQRELLASKIKTMLIAPVIINSLSGSPLYKLCISPNGDFMIFTNTSQYRNIIRSIASPLDDLNDNYDLSVSAAYTSAWELLRSSKVKRAVYQEHELISENSEERSIAPSTNWKLVFSLPAMECRPLVETIYTLFRDDLHNNED